MPYTEKKYHIEVPHFYCLEYYENDKKMIVELDFRETLFFLNKKLIKHWEEPNKEEIITEVDKERILFNIRDFLLSITIPSNIHIDIDVN